MYRELLAREVGGGFGQNETLIVSLVAEVYSRLRHVVEWCESLSQTETVAAVGGHVGRPKFIIPYNTLEYLIKSRFTVPQISDLMGVSISTVRRRMTDYNLSIQETYTAKRKIMIRK